MTRSPFAPPGTVLPPVSGDLVEWRIWIWGSGQQSCFCQHFWTWNPTWCRGNPVWSPPLPAVAPLAPAHTLCDAHGTQPPPVGGAGWPLPSDFLSRSTARGSSSPLTYGLRVSHPETVPSSFRVLSLSLSLCTE